MDDIVLLGKPIGKDRVFSREEVILLATNPEHSLRDRALFVTLYLSNSRVSEIVKRLRRMDIKQTDVEGEPFLMFTHLFTCKNKQHPERNIPIKIERERELVNVLAEYLALFDTGEAILFDMTKQRAWQLMKRMCGQRTHYIRHTRLTHLVTEYGLTETALTKMAGWSNSKPAVVYIHLGWKDIAKMM